MIKNLLQKNKGYALMFTVVVVSIISLIAIGLSNATYKQMILSSIARDSQTAFYMADTVVECIEYQDNVVGKFPSNSTAYAGSTFTCGSQNGGTLYTLTVAAIALPALTNITGAYSINLLGNSAGGTAWSSEVVPCFGGTVYKFTVPHSGDPVFGNDTTIDTQILGSGYNICNKNNTRTVERTIKVNY
jgi:Tfp pilus assembly protein PilX